MPTLGEFCSSNIARFLLAIVIVIAVILIVGVVFFYSPGRGHHLQKTSRLLLMPAVSSSPAC